MSRTTTRDTWLATGLAVIAIPAGAVFLYAPRILAGGDTEQMLLFLMPLLLVGAGVAFGYGVVTSSAVLALARLRTGFIWVSAFILLTLVGVLPAAIEQLGHVWEVSHYPIPPRVGAIERKYGNESRIRFGTSLSLKETSRFYDRHMTNAGWTLDQHHIATVGEDTARGGFRSAQYVQGLDIVTVNMVEAPEGTRVTILRTFSSHFW